LQPAGERKKVSAKMSTPCRIQFGDTAGYKPALPPEGAPLIFGIRDKAFVSGGFWTRLDAPEKISHLF
jgi:hypothetical protein